MKATMPLLVPALLALAACNPQSPPPTGEPPGSALEQPPVLDGSAMPGQPADALPTRLRAHGNEPFWNVEVDGSTLVYTRMGEGEPVTLQSTRSADGQGVQFSGEHDGQPYRLGIRSEACPNTMSDETHEFTASFDSRGEALSGCADRGE